MSGNKLKIKIFKFEIVNEFYTKFYLNLKQFHNYDLIFFLHMNKIF